MAGFEADDGGVRIFAITAVLALSLTSAPAALADNVGISISSTSPEQGVPLTITLSGSAGAIDSDGDGGYLYAVARPSGGVGCQSSFGADQVAAGDASTVVVDGDEQEPGQPFSEQEDFTPDVGGSLVCAWVETDGDDGDDVATPNEVTAGPVSATFTAASPTVGPLKVNIPASIKVNQAYDITYSTQTDQDLSLDSIVIPTGGAGCAASYELEADDVSNPDDIFDGGTDIYGTASTTGIDKETTAGSYTICSWIEGPDNAQVDATSATNIKVLAAGAATPATSSAGSGGSGSGGSGSGSSGSGPSGSGSGSSGPGSSGSSSGSATGAACVVPTYTRLTLAQLKRRLHAANCTVGDIRRVKRVKVKAGQVLKLSAAPGKQLKHDAPVGITIAKR